MLVSPETSETLPSRQEKTLRIDADITWDYNRCYSEKRALRTVEAGDVVNILEGKYTQSFYPTKSGVKDNPITFQGKGKVIFNGAIKLSNNFQKVPETDKCYQITVPDYLIRSAWFQNDRYIMWKNSLSEVEKQSFSLWHDYGNFSETLSVGPDEKLLKLKHNNLHPEIRLYIPSRKTNIEDSDFE